MPPSSCSTTCARAICSTSWPTTARSKRSVPSWRNSTTKRGPRRVGFVDGLYAGGSTDIDGALKRALGMLADSKRPTYVLFLTDGLPTTGETDESAIVKHSEKHNDVRARVFAFGVGYDVNSRLLDKLARANFGLSQYVRPNEDIEASVSALYRKIGAPVMTDVKVTVDVEENGDGSSRTDQSHCIPKGEFDLFAGDQVVLVGRYRASGAAKVKLRGKIGDDEKSFDFPAKLVEKSDDDTNAFVAKLWATRRVGDIIDELDLKGRNEELVNELVALATEHGILTPYTSFLADETSDVREVAQNRARDAGTKWKHSPNRPAVMRFSQRESKLEPANGKPGPGRVGQRPGRGRGGYGGGDGIEPTDRYWAAGGGYFGGNVRYYDAAGDKDVAAANIRQIGRKTFFQRGEPVGRFHRHRRRRKIRRQDRALQPRVLRPDRTSRQARRPVPGARRAGRRQARRHDVHVVSCNVERSRRDRRDLASSLRRRIDCDIRRCRRR